MVWAQRKAWDTSGSNGCRLYPALKEQRDSETEAEDDPLEIPGRDKGWGNLERDQVSLESSFRVELGP